MTIKHAFVSPKSDVADPTLVRPSDWNADHTGGVTHDLATAANDMLVASGAGAFIKKTLAEVKTLLAIATDIATHAALTATHGAAFIAGVTSGSYIGDSTENRAIAHGLGRTPKIVLLWCNPAAATSGFLGIWVGAPTAIIFIDATSNTLYDLTAMDSTNFYVGHAADYFRTGNHAIGYFWVAIG